MPLYDSSFTVFFFFFFFFIIRTRFTLFILSYFSTISLSFVSEWKRGGERAAGAVVCIFRVSKSSFVVPESLKDLKKAGIVENLENAAQRPVLASSA